MRTTPRRRRPLGPVALAILRPLLRYSYTREAYVLRLIGNHRGAVFVRRETVDVVEAAEAVATGLDAPSPPGPAARGLAEPATVIAAVGTSNGDPGVSRAASSAGEPGPTGL